MGNGSVSLTPAGVGLGPVARVVAPAQEGRKKKKLAVALLSEDPSPWTSSKKTGSRTPHEKPSISETTGGKIQGRTMFALARKAARAWRI